MHILPYNKKGLCRLNGNYNSIPFKPRMSIQIRESDPVLVNKTQLVTKRNYSNNQKTTSNLTNKAPRHYDFQSNELLVAWDNRRVTLENQQVCLKTAPFGLHPKKHSILCSRLLSDIGQPNCSMVCLRISEVVKKVSPSHRGAERPGDRGARMTR